MANETEVIIRNKLTELENQKNNLVKNIRFVRDSDPFHFEEFSKGFIMQYGMIWSSIIALKEVSGIEIELVEREYLEEMQKLFGVGA